MSDGKGTVTGLKILKAIVWFIYVLTGAAVIFISFGFALLLFNANTSSGFVQFIYKWTEFFAQPFVGMVDPTKLANGGMISWSALFAIAAYAVIGWVVGSVLNAISRRIYCDTKHDVVAQSKVTETHPLADGGVVAKETTAPVVAPSVVEQTEAEKAAEEARRVAAEQPETPAATPPEQ